MTAFVIATITDVKDPEKFGQYGAAAAQTLTAHGGEAILRGKFAKSLNADQATAATGIMRFPDLEAVDRWYGSPEYQALIPLRDAACDMTMTAYAVPA